MRFPLTLLGLYLAVFVICAIEPYDHSVWLAENAPIWIIVGLIIQASRYYRFSNLAYGLMFGMRRRTCSPTRSARFL